jgi:P27 family predicted phage terminase small subunit
MPAHIRKSPEGTKFWRQHCHMLQDAGRLEPEYRATFGRLCLVHARIREYSDQIEKDGAIIEGARGGKQKHPLLTPLRQAESIFTELSGRFGLDPKSAQRLPSPVKVACDRRERLLANDNEWNKLAQYINRGRP